MGKLRKKDSNELNKILEIVFKEHNRAKGKRTLKYSWKKMKMDYFAGSPESEIPSYGQFTKRYRDAFKKSLNESGLSSVIRSTEKTYLQI